MAHGKKSKTRYGYIYRDGDRRDVYKAGEGLILTYPHVYRIVSVSYNPVSDQTTIKFDRWDEGGYNDKA